MKNPKVTFTFSTGDKVAVILYPEIAPISVANFLSYAKEGYYKGTIMHRIIENFMIQGGGYYVNNGTLAQKETKRPIKGEFSQNGVNNTISHTAGTISMARTSVNDSATSQFFICSVDYPHLDGSYAAFGRVADKASLDAVVRMSQVDTGRYGNMSDFPLEVIYITDVKVEE